MQPALSSHTPELRRLAAKAVNTSASVRPRGTQLTYNSQLRMFWAWARSNTDCTGYPVPVHIMAMYLVHRSESAGTFSTVKQSFFALRAAHTTLQLPDPTQNKLVRDIYDVAERELPANIHRKEPVTPEMIQYLLQYLQRRDINLTQRVCITAGVFSFFIFARASDMQVLRADDVVERGKYVEVFVESAKNDQRRDGRVVHLPVRLAADDGTLGSCMRLLREAVSRQSPDLDISQVALFPGVKAGEVHETKSVSYSHYSRVVKQTLKEGNFDVTDIGTHSFRSGGMTAASAMDADFDRLLQHGRFRSDRAAKRYIAPSVKKAVSVGVTLHTAVEDPAAMPEVVQLSASALAKHKKRKQGSRDQRRM